MKRFAFTVQPYNQKITVYYNYGREAIERILDREGIPNDPPWSWVFTVHNVELRKIIVVLMKPKSPAQWAEWLAHETFHVAQAMHEICGIGLYDDEAGAFIAGYVARKLHEGCR